MGAGGVVAGPRGGGPEWMQPGVGAGLDASPGAGEGCCGACLAVGGAGSAAWSPLGWGAGPRAPAGTRTSPARPRPLACGCVAASPPPGCVSRCHPRTAAALRNLGLRKERGNRGGRPAAGRGRTNGPWASVRVCGGPPGPPPPHLRVTSWAPAWSPPLALHPAAGGGSTCRLHVDPVGTGAPPPTRPHCAGAGGQVQLGTSARLPASHPPSRHLLDFAPGWCPLWGDF